MTSWKATRRRGRGYRTWLGSRLQWLLGPVLPLLALGITQIGLMMTLEQPARRWLSGLTPWAVTVLINGMITTIFLWHSTAIMLTIGLGFYMRPDVFSAAPGAGVWWAFRPVWVTVFAVSSLPFLLGFSRFERAGAAKDQAGVPEWRLYLGCVITCFALEYLALKGIGSGPHWIYDAVSLISPFVGTAFAGFGPLSRILKHGG